MVWTEHLRWVRSSRECEERGVVGPIAKRSQRGGVGVFEGDLRPRRAPTERRGYKSSAGGRTALIKRGYREDWLFFWSIGFEEGAFV